MAITLADFTKIWASTSPLTPYSFSESNYKEGWNFIGGTPPARQMWDFIQKQNDEKMKYIVDSFLPLSGGTMTGAIVLADGGNPLSTAGGTMVGAIVGNPLTLTADDENDSADLVLNPSGSATWNGKEVERVNASGTNYIRYESGLQICWGTTASVTTNAGTSTTTTVNFPVAFKDATYTVTFVDRFGSGAWTNHTFSTSSYTTTSVGLYLQNNAGGGYTYTLSWMAIGYWK